MAEIVRYVDTDVSGGAGDGTSWANAYHSLYDCEAGQQQDLTDSGGDWMHIYCKASSGTADSTHGQLYIIGWTTGAANYILIEAADGYQALATSWSTTRYIYQGTDIDVVYVQEEYVRFKGLQIAGVYSSTANKYMMIVTDVGTSVVYVYNCRFKGSTDTNSNMGGIQINDADCTAYIFNTIIYDCDGRGFRNTNSTNTYIYNCTIYNCQLYGVDRAAGTVTINNCAIFNTADDLNGTLTIDYNAIDDADAQTHNIAETGGGASWTGDFNDAANGNFSLKVGSGLIGTGVADPGSGLYSDDIAGTARGAAWDVGAFEYVAAGGSSVAPQAMAHFMRMRRN